MTARVKAPRVVLAVALTVACVGSATAMGTSESDASTVTRWTGTMPETWITMPATAPAPASAPAPVAEPVEVEPVAAAAVPVEAPAAEVAAAPEPMPEPVAAAPAPANTGSSVAAIRAPKGPSPDWIREQNEASESLRKEQLSRVGDGSADAPAAD
jgi:hypothetical protein